MDKGELAIINELSALAHMRWRKSCEQQYPDEPPRPDLGWHKMVTLIDTLVALKESEQVV